MEFRNLSKVYQDVISDICHKMGVGMAEFLEKKVDSQHEWDKVSQARQEWTEPEWDRGVKVGEAL